MKFYSFTALLFYRVGYAEHRYSVWEGKRQKAADAKALSTLATIVPEIGDSTM